MKQYIAVFMRPGSHWDQNKPVREQAYWDEHALFMDSQFETGKVILAGPFADGSGSLVILAVDSGKSAREFYQHDPWTIHDVLVVADTKEWTIFLDGRSLDQ